MSNQNIALRRVTIVCNDGLYCLACANAWWTEKLVTRALQAGPKSSIEDTMHNMGRLRVETASATSRCCICEKHIH